MSDKFNNNFLTLPSNAQLQINRCNLPASIIGGLTYNEQPVPLLLDSVAEMHKNLFLHLKKFDDIAIRRSLFYEYMNGHFQLSDLSQMGQSDTARLNRKNVNYKKIIFGWHMNPNGFEGAVIKRWVESRFGLLPRFHKKLIRNYYDVSYHRYLGESSVATYNTNAIESQLDVLYCYNQYELSLRCKTHITLYRGLNHLNDHEILEKDNNLITILLNNINSFSTNIDIAHQFGDYVIEIKVPKYKIFCFNGTLPKQINAEDEYISIGGLFRAKLCY